MSGDIFRAGGPVGDFVSVQNEVYLPGAREENMLLRLKFNME